MSRANNILLFVMLISCVGMFSFFPFLVSILTGHYSFSAADVGVMMSAGVIAGNILSMAICLYLREDKYKFYFTISLMLFALSILGMLFKKEYIGDYGYFILIISCVIIYRMSVGIYYNISRAYQIAILDDRNKKLDLFLKIKFVNSLGGGIGPVVGQLMLNYGGHEALFVFCAAIFILSAGIVTCFIPGIGKSQGNQPAPVYLGLSKVLRDRRFVLLSVGAMLHYIFEAQIYTFITLQMIDNSIANVVAYVFTLNSIFLIAFSIAGERMVAQIESIPKILLLGTGSALSCVSLILTPLVTDYIGLTVVVFLFSIGEYLVPQLAVDLITDQSDQNLQRITLFNFMTSAVGLGIGFMLGSYLFDLNSGFIASVMWITILVSIVLLFSLAMKNPDDVS